MDDKRVKVRVRLIVIKNDKILLSFVKDENFYFFIGGKMEFGETLLQACLREISEECNGAKFNFTKILYVRDYIKPEKNEHSLELYVLGDIDKFEELEGLKDPEFGDNHWQTWVDLGKLESLDVRPQKLVNLIIEDYKSNFSGETKYLGEID